MTASSKQKARSRLMQARAAAAAERQARERAAAAERKVRERQNVNDLAEFEVQTAKADEEIDAWLAARIEKLRQEADERRRRHRVAAGKALAALRSRGESVASIAEQAGISVPKVREYLKLAATDEATETDAGPALDEQEPSDTTAAAPDRDHQDVDAPTPVGAAH
jgi:hypothetical protein